MSQILETVMLLCFGISWPISVYKSITTRSTQGKSPIFMAAILLGYTAGIVSKVISHEVNYVLMIYIFNFLVVSCDFLLFYVNRKRELKLA